MPVKTYTINDLTADDVRLIVDLLSFHMPTGGGCPEMVLQRHIAKVTGMHSQTDYMAIHRSLVDEHLSSNENNLAVTLAQITGTYQSVYMAPIFEQVERETGVVLDIVPPPYEGHPNYTPDAIIVSVAGMLAGSEREAKMAPVFAAFDSPDHLHYIQERFGLTLSGSYEDAIIFRYTPPAE